MAYHQEVEIEKATSAFEKAVELNPDSVLAHFRLGVLYEEHVVLVLAQTRRRLSRALRRRYDTLDIGHSVFIEILQGLPRFEDRGATAFRNWVAVKAEYKIRSKLRKLLLRRGGRREVTLIPGTSPEPCCGESGPLSHSIRDEEDVRLFRALRGLDESYRSVLRLRSDEALSHGEVAQLLHLPSADAARKLYVRALVRLRREWKSV